MKRAAAAVLLTSIAVLTGLGAATLIQWVADALGALNDYEEPEPYRGESSAEFADRLSKCLAWAGDPLGRTVQ